MDVDERRAYVVRLHTKGATNIQIAKALEFHERTIARDLDFLGLDRWDRVTNVQLDVMVVHALKHLHKRIGIKGAQGHIRGTFKLNVQRSLVRASLKRLHMLREMPARIKRRSYFNSIGKDNVWCARMRVPHRNYF
jgi:hypothetical protein